MRESEINSLCKAVAHEVDVKTIVTNDVRYKEKEDSNSNANLPNKSFKIRSFTKKLRDFSLMDKQD